MSSASAAPSPGGAGFELLADARTTATWNVVLTREAAGHPRAQRTGAAAHSDGRRGVLGPLCFVGEARSPRQTLNRGPRGSWPRPARRSAPAAQVTVGCVRTPTVTLCLPMDPRIERARQIVECEAVAVRQVADGLGEPFLRALDMILGLSGRVVTTGMGKAGFIAQKISATLASTGTPSIFLHPAEAIHGDLGRVDEGDLLLAFSKAGETAELLVMLPHVKACGATLVAITQGRGSTLGGYTGARVGGSRPPPRAGAERVDDGDARAR